MANANPSRVGQIGAAGDTKALFLKVFSGEVMSVYNNLCVMKDRTKVITVKNGKSVQIPAIGKAKAAYHTAGAEILGDILNMGEQVITLDDILYAAAFVDDLDAAMSHFEYRQEYSKQLGEALAQQYDLKLLSLAVKTARDPSGLGKGVADQGNAESITLVANTQIADIRAGFFTAATKFAQKKIPLNDRFAVVPPDIFYRTRAGYDSDQFALFVRSRHWWYQLSEGYASFYRWLPSGYV